MIENMNIVLRLTNPRPQNSFDESRCFESKSCFNNPVYANAEIPNNDEISISGPSNSDNFDLPLTHEGWR